MPPREENIYSKFRFSDFMVHHFSRVFLLSFHAPAHKTRQLEHKTKRRHKPRCVFLHKTSACIISVPLNSREFERRTVRLWLPSPKFSVSLFFIVNRGASPWKCPWNTTLSTAPYQRHPRDHEDASQWLHLDRPCFHSNKEASAPRRDQVTRNERTSAKTLKKYMCACLWKGFKYVLLE